MSVMLSALGDRRSRDWATKSIFLTCLIAKRSILPAMSEAASARLSPEFVKRSR